MLDGANLIMNHIDDPFHYAEVQCMILANQLQCVSIKNIYDLEYNIGKLQSTMHVLFEVKEVINNSNHVNY